MEVDRIAYIELGKKRRALLIKRMRKFFEERREVKLAILFGSCLRRDYCRDIDIAIYAPELGFDELLKLGAELELLLKVPVDLVPWQELAPSFRKDVLLEGKVILCRDESLYHRLLSSTYSELQDLKLARTLSI